MIIEDALTKLNSESDTIKENKMPVEPIVNYLSEQVSKDDKFAEVVLNKDKTLKGCIDYIFKKAREIIKGSCGCLEDKVVYEIARDYFYEPVEEPRKFVPKNKNCKDKKNKDGQMTLESLNAEKPKLNDSNIKEKTSNVEDNVPNHQTEKTENNNINSASNIVHFEEKKAKKEIQKLKNEYNNFEGQVSIFDLM